VNNEMTTISDHRPMGPNPLGLRLVLLRSTYGQKMSSKLSGHFGYLPRELIYVCSKVVFATFIFSQKTQSWSPSVVSQKINFIDTSWSLFWFMPIRVVIIFCTLWTCFSLVRSLFYEIEFLTDPWGGPGLSFFRKNKCCENNFEHT
jgi:hypothetical protein